MLPNNFDFATYPERDTRHTRRESFSRPSGMILVRYWLRRARRQGRATKFDLPDMAIRALDPLSRQYILFDQLSISFPLMIRARFERDRKVAAGGLWERFRLGES